jgi:D-proline reductase (dithiol) PrdB
MTRLDKYSEEERSHLLGLPCPSFKTTAFAIGPSLAERRIALISTAGLHRREDRPFTVGESDYRLISVDTPANDLVMSHIFTNFDRTGFQLDLNLVFPLDRLSELVKQGFINSLADYHYSFMGATDPRQMENAARNLSKIMKKDGVDSVLLVPV